MAMVREPLDTFVQACIRTTSGCSRSAKNIANKNAMNTHLLAYTNATAAANTSAVARTTAVRLAKSHIVATYDFIYGTGEVRILDASPPSAT
jgi:hypothetical protein